MDKSIEGNRGQPFRVVAEEGKIREFARAVKSSNPAYVAEGPQATSPPTFLASSAFWQRPENSPWGDTRLNWQRILHGEQEFVFFGAPPAAGTELTAEHRIDRVFEKEGKRGGTMTFVELVTEYRDGSGAVVAEARSTIIERRRFKVQWREQAWPGDVLTYSGVVSAKREEDGQRLVDLEMTVTRQTGGTHLKGWATFVVPE